MYGGGVILRAVFLWIWEVLPACPMNPALARGHYETREASYKARVSGKAGPASQGRRAEMREWGQSPEGESNCIATSLTL